MDSSILLLFVVECNEISMTDVIYINYFLRTFHKAELASNRLIVKFVFMDGKNNYNKKDVKRNVAQYVNEAKGSKIKCEVIYCFDTDRINNNNKEFLSRAISYVEENGYRVVLFNPEIENMFNVDINIGKTQAALSFKRHEPSKDSIKIKNFSVDKKDVLSQIGTSNLAKVINNILGNVKRGK